MGQPYHPTGTAPAAGVSPTPNAPAATPSTRDNGPAKGDGYAY
jgi:hypothetical protein